MATKKKESRRGHNEGSIYKLDNGKWVGSVTIGYDENGKRKRKVYYGKTRSEVVIKMSEIQNQTLRNGYLNIKDDKIEVVFHEWLATFKRAEVSARTFESVVRNTRLHIMPYIGNFKLNEVNSNIVQALLNKMIFNQYSPATVRKIKFILNQFFDYCRKSNFIVSNPVLDCKVKPLRDHQELTVNKYKAIPNDIRNFFLKIVVEDEILCPICMIQIYGGLRIGEVLALKWENFDFKNKRICINKAITEIPEIDNNWKVVSRKTVISNTKTCASEREIPMTKTLEYYMLRWREIRKKKEKELGISFLNKMDLVFSNNEGKLRTYYGIRSMFDRLVKKNNLSEYNIHFHSLRHTFSTILFEASENPKVIQQLLGHKDVKTTISVYNSVDRSYYQQATNKLEFALGQVK